VPAGGGAPQVWFSDPRLVAPFGPNGIRLSPDHTKVYFIVTGLGVPGVIYTLPITTQPTANDLQIVHTYTEYEGPDDLAFGGSGKLYVTLAGTSEVSVIAPSGSETRLQSNLYDSPANIAFDNRTGSLILANHAAFTQDPSSFALLETYVGDRDEPLATPSLP
jgi:sugar lactone lactonase YvrE